MDFIAIFAFEILTGIASLALICVGLAVLFGMMGVINFAHGEFIMLGGYATILAVKAGFNIWIAMLVVAPLAVGIVGIIVERLVIRHLYGRLIDTLLATWGLSLFLSGLVISLLGYSIEGVSAPLGNFAIGDVSVSAYRGFLILSALVVYGGLYLALKRTRWGLIARGTMQSPQMAASLGINPQKVYMVTFGAGAALSGLAGGLLTPIAGVSPTIGVAYVAQAFITVITGGQSILAGTGASAILLGSINQGTTFFSNAVTGQIALLAAAIILLRLIPAGITSRFFRGGV